MRSAYAAQYERRGRIPASAYSHRERACLLSAHAHRHFHAPVRRRIPQHEPPGPPSTPTRNGRRLRPHGLAHPGPRPVGGLLILTPAPGPSALPVPVRAGAGSMTAAPFIPAPESTSVRLEMPTARRSDTTTPGRSAFAPRSRRPAGASRSSPRSAHRGCGRWPRSRMRTGNCGASNSRRPRLPDLESRRRLNA